MWIFFLYFLLTVKQPLSVKTVTKYHLWSCLSNPTFNHRINQLIMMSCMDVLLLLPGVMGLVTDYMHGVNLYSIKKVGDSTETKSVWVKWTGKVKMFILVWIALLYGHTECEPIYISLKWLDFSLWAFVIIIYLCVFVCTKLLWGSLYIVLIWVCG